MILSIDERRAREAILLKNIKRDLPALTRLSEDAESHWGSEDLVYRFYHQSFKVFAIQSLTTTIVNALQALLPETRRSGRCPAFQSNDRDIFYQRHCAGISRTYRFEEIVGRIDSDLPSARSNDSVAFG